MDYENTKTCAELKTIEIPKGKYLKVSYSNPKFSKKMLKKIHPKMSSYIISLQENKAQFSPEEFIRIEETVKEEKQSLDLFKKSKPNVQLSCNVLIDDQTPDESYSSLPNNQMNYFEYESQNYSNSNFINEYPNQNQNLDSNNYSDHQSQIFNERAPGSNVRLDGMNNSYADISSVYHYNRDSSRNDLNSNYLSDSFSQKSCYDNQINSMDSFYTYSKEPCQNVNNHTYSNQANIKNDLEHNVDNLSYGYNNQNSDYTSSYGPPVQPVQINQNCDTVYKDGTSQNYFVEQEYQNNGNVDDQSQFYGKIPEQSFYQSDTIGYYNQNQNDCNTNQNLFYQNPLPQNNYYGQFYGSYQNQENMTNNDQNSMYNTSNFNGCNVNQQQH